MNNFNYRLTQFFINNPKITVLSLIFLIFFGLFATLNLQTTGFPSPSLGIISIRTIYPGASSDEVNKNVTEKIEEQIKTLNSEIESYSSNSTNSVSIITISTKIGVNTDIFRNKLESTISNAKLPATIDKPSIFVPQISGTSYLLSIVNDDMKVLFEEYTNLRSELKKLSGVLSAEPVVALKKRVVIDIDESFIKERNISINDIKSKIATLNESFPVVSDKLINGYSHSITTNISNNSLNDLLELKIVKNAPSITLPNGTIIPAKSNVYSISDLAKIDIVYEYENQPIFVSYKSGEKFLTKETLQLDVRAAENTDQSKLTADIESILAKFSKNSVKIDRDNKIITTINNSTLIRNTVAYDNTKDQVDEVISGLVGGPLKIDGNLKYIGYLLGGIQLIVLVMILFVSWRAALIGALAIPLSLIFSNIYLFMIGESLNTLVLFSLVLVLGLVVDPALVVLEAIQRKVDSGKIGNEAVLAAVKDVGKGIFLATLTNIIVFAPFGIISGFLGKIFSYIPLTIIPATIGSYIVPLVFLAWLGGKFLRPTTSTTIINKTKSVNTTTENIHNDAEYINLWSIAKTVVKLNLKILNSNVAVKIAILLLGIIIPLGIALYYFNTRQITTTQFSQTGGNGLVSIIYQPKSALTSEQKTNLKKEIIEQSSKVSGVEQVYQINQQGITAIFVKFDLTSLKSEDILSKINNLKTLIDTGKSNGKSNSEQLFDLIVREVSNAGGATNYQVSIAIKESDIEKAKIAALDIAKLAKDTCYVNNDIVFDSNCKGLKIVTKIDDGFTDKSNKVIDIEINRAKVDQFSIPNAPLILLVNQTIKNQFEYDNKKVGNIVVDGDNLEIYLTNPEENPKTIDDIKNIEIISLRGEKVKLSDIAKIVEKDTKTNIQKIKGETQAVVQIRLQDKYNDQSISAKVTNAIVNHYNKETNKLSSLGLVKDQIASYSEGNTASFLKSFSELGLALGIAILLTYIVLAIFFNSLTVPAVILYTIPLTFIGVMPALAHLGLGEFGFLEIIGIIILVGIVENVAIFLIDAARQKINEEGWGKKEAISYAAGVRFRPVILTTVTAIVSLLPLVLFSPFYRSIGLVIMSGLLTSGVISLITTPILYDLFVKEKKIKS